MTSTPHPSQTGVPNRDGVPNRTDRPTEHVLNAGRTRIVGSRGRVYTESAAP